MCLANAQQVHLDDLVLHQILNHLDATNLAAVAKTSTALRKAVKLTAYEKLQLSARSQNITLQTQTELLQQLHKMEFIAKNTVFWLRADQDAMQSVSLKDSRGNQKNFQYVRDLSSHENHAYSTKVSPTYCPDAVNGYGAFEFAGASVLKTRPFAQPLPQPITIMIVARATGDTTLIDALGPRYSLDHPPILLYFALNTNLFFYPTTSQFKSIRTLPWVSYRLEPQSRDLHDCVRP